MLGGDVGRLEGAGAQAVDAGDVDDATPAPRRTCAGRLCRISRNGDVEHEVEDEVEAVEREVLDRAHVLDAGVVDEDVDLGRQVGRARRGRRGPPRSWRCPSPRRARRGPPRRGRRRAPWLRRPRGPRATLAPMPLAAPVTRAVRPVRSMGSLTAREPRSVAVRGVVACVVAGVGHAGRLGTAGPGHLCGDEHKTPDPMWTAHLTSRTIAPGRPPDLCLWRRRRRGPDAGEVETVGQDERGVGPGRRRRGRPHVPRGSVCRPARRCRPAPAAGPHPPWQGVRDATPPRGGASAGRAPAHRRAPVPDAAEELGRRRRRASGGASAVTPPTDCPQPQHLDAGSRRCRSAGDGLDPGRACSS